MKFCHALFHPVGHIQCCSLAQETTHIYIQNEEVRKTNSLHNLLKNFHAILLLEWNSLHKIRLCQNFSSSSMCSGCDSKLLKCFFRREMGGRRQKHGHQSTMENEMSWNFFSRALGARCHVTNIWLKTIFHVNAESHQKHKWAKIRWAMSTNLSNINFSRSLHDLHSSPNEVNSQSTLVAIVWCSVINPTAHGWALNDLLFSHYTLWIFILHPSRIVCTSHPSSHFKFTAPEERARLLIDVFSVLSSSWNAFSALLHSTLRHRAR